MKIAILLALVGHSMQKSLFTLHPDVDTSLIRPCQGKAFLSCVVAEVDFDNIGADVISIPECGHLMNKTFIQQTPSRTGGPTSTTSLSYNNNYGCDSLISYRDDHVMGNFHLQDGRNFVLEPCSFFPGCHVWKEHNPSMFFDHHGEPVPPNTRKIFNEEEVSELKNKGSGDDDTIVIYSTKMYYTIEFAQHTDDIELYFDQIEAEVNQGYINSLIPVRMQIYDIEAADLHDIEDSSQMLTAFRNYKSSVSELRDGADTAACVLYDFEACGRGYVDSWDTGLTLTVSMKRCALGYFSMGHEIGHNFGCAHDREHASSSPYSYGYGAYIGSGPYRTILAYSKTGYKTRVNVYSSPSVTYEGIVTGSANEDNARVITNNRFAMADVGEH